MNPSHQQQAIFSNVSDGTGHTVVVARAGCGKTTTIVESFKHVPRPAARDVLMVAFNKSIATELQERAPAGVEVSTLHSYGLRQLSRALNPRPAINADKMRDIAKTLVEPLGIRDRSVERETRAALCSAASFAKGNLAHTAEDVDMLLDARGIMVPPEVEREVFVEKVVESLKMSLEDQGQVDFDDMVWMPCRFKMSLAQSSRVFVDETQDLNPCQIKLALKAVRPGGRICAVGDDRQAIYGFRGADENAVDNVIEKLEAQKLGLSITYRCAKSIVAEARRIVPDFECPEDAPEGFIEPNAGTYSRVIRDARPGDFVLSRSNAPLVSLCFAFIREGIKVAIQGRDIGAKLRGTVNRMHASTVEELTKKVQQWQGKEVARLTELERDPSNVIDTAECILTICDVSDSVGEVLSRIENLFSDDAGDPRTRIVLSSTHKAKGLERERVWLLRDTYLRSRKDANGEWQEPDVEEENLYYVAVTRAKRELYMVRRAA